MTKPILPVGESIVLACANAYRNATADGRLYAHTRACISALLDALSEPSDAMMDIGNEYTYPSTIWRAMLATFREEQQL